MNFIISNKQSVAPIVLEKELHNTLYKMTDIFADDIRKVCETKPEIVSEIPQNESNIIIVGIAGKSAVLDKFQDKLSSIMGKRECYTIFSVKDAFFPCQNALVIAGSDKRGAVYGMFSISEKIGVSPWYFWADATVAHKDEIVITEESYVTSKEPSVNYRGLFINDEQPCFGNWAREKYGSINPGPELYEKIFELILRLKGNYLWPAMWRSDFTLNNIENARLATEMGIVVGASHHEPCCRSGQEFQILNKTNPQYGKDWSFLSNAEGITEFWKDGLIRNKDFENLITIGMRGENDSYLMPENATLEDNINVLKSAITAQKELISKYAPSEHPQLLAIYKEVEDYYYGDENTPGLKDWDVLKDDIMMLCDDNFANVRTLPDDELRKHPGGFGMYYHFDYFGSPVSYLWSNTSPLSKVWEQMTTAYDYGIRSAWIVNVGDIKNQELPLSYFMDLSYDFDKWGTSAINKTAEYTVEFFKKLGFEKDTASACAELVKEYTNVNAKRRPEPLKADTYHPVHEHEAENMLKALDHMTEASESLYKTIKGSSLEECFFQLVYYPVNAVAAINRMNIYAGLNVHYSSQGKKCSGKYAQLVEKSIFAERKLTDEYHTRNNGKWNHMQSVAHIGYNNWNEERWEYPRCQTYYPVRDARLLVSRTDIDDCTNSNRWTRHVIDLPIYLDTCPCNTIEVANGGEQELQYRIDWDAEWISVETESGTKFGKNTALSVDDTTTYRIKVDPEKWDNTAATTVRIYGDNCEEMSDESENHTSFPMVEVNVEVIKLNIDNATEDYSDCSEKDNAKRFFVESNGCISIEAVHFNESISSDSASYKIIEDYGKTLGGIKAYPQTLRFDQEKDAPAVKYKLFAKDSGEYTCNLYVAASNPVMYKGKMEIGIRSNAAAAQIINTIPDEGFIPWKSDSWSKGVLDQIHIATCKLHLEEGLNEITLFARDASVVVEKLVLWNPECEIRDSYLGPNESKVSFLNN